VDYCDLDVLRVGAELGLSVIGDEGDERFAVLVGMNLPAENVLQVFVLEDRSCDRGCDPQDLFLRVNLGCERHGLRAGVNAIHDVDFLLIDQPLDFIDRDINLALAVGIGRDDLVFAGDAAALIDEIDRYLRADRACRRAARGEWTGQVIDDADPNRFGLCGREASRNRQCCGSRSRFLKQRATRSFHGVSSRADRPSLRL